MNSSEYKSNEKISSKVNLGIKFIVILIGLIGNCIVLLLFCKKKFRTNPSQVYLLSSAAVDSLFLIVHFIEV